MFAYIDTGSNNVLRQAVVPTLSFQACRAKWGNSMSSNKMCASTASGKGICFGDSGGPLVCKQGNKWLQYGINSFVYKYDCVHPNYPTVYASVVSLLPWIQQKTGSTYLHIYCVLSIEMLMFRGQVGLGLTNISGWIYHRVNGNTLMLLSHWRMAKFQRHIT